MGAGEVKNFSVGICDGPPSTARSSCEYMYCLFTGKRKISVENITFYLWKSVKNTKNSSQNYIIL